MKERFQMNKTKWIIALLSVLFVVTFIVGYQVGEMRSEPTGTSDTVTVVEFDTITFTKDTTITKFIPKIIEKLRVDTVKKDSVLIKERKTYNNTLCHEGDSIQLTTTISGYEAALDSISAKWSKHQITKTEYITITKTIKNKKKINVGLQAGYGIGLKDKEFQPYVGLGLQYNF